MIVSIAELLVPFEFCTVTGYVPGLTRRMYIGHIEPVGQFGAIDVGIVMVSV